MDMIQEINFSLDFLQCVHNLHESLLVILGWESKAHEIKYRQLIFKRFYKCEICNRCGIYVCMYITDMDELCACRFWVMLKEMTLNKILKNNPGTCNLWLVMLMAKQLQLPFFSMLNIKNT